jgi:hypothetical protein
MLNFLTKFVFLLKRPKIIIVTGNNKDAVCNEIFDVLDSDFCVEIFSPHTKNFSVGVSKGVGVGAKDIWQNQVLILPFSDKEEYKLSLSFFIKKSCLPILVVANMGEVPSDKLFFTGDKEKIKSIIEITKKLPNYGKLIFCFDDETVREIQERANCDCLSFGFGQKADFCASDVNFGNGGTNFKINYKGNIVPVWLVPKKNSKQDIYNSLSAACCGIVLGMNLVEISEILKNTDVGHL